MENIWDQLIRADRALRALPPDTREREIRRLEQLAAGEVVSPPPEPLRPEAAVPAVDLEAAAAETTESAPEARLQDWVEARKEGDGRRRGSKPMEPHGPFATAPICSHYRGPHREWPVALKLEPIGKSQ